MAFSEAFKNNKQWKRIILLGPMHRPSDSRKGCPFRISPFDAWQGVGKIPILVDHDARQKLLNVQSFQEALDYEDLAEHSIELQLPIIEVLQSHEIVKILPIYTTGCDLHSLVQAAQLIVPLLEETCEDQRSTLLVISTDFCHWGECYGYKPFLEDEKDETLRVPLSLKIKSLDEGALKSIESESVQDFDEYLKQTGNTICGRDPIRTTMLIQGMLGKRMKSITWTWIDYRQSSELNNPKKDDLSVSYVAGILHR